MGSFLYSLFNVRRWRRSTESSDYDLDSIVQKNLDRLLVRREEKFLRHLSKRTGYRREDILRGRDSVLTILGESSKKEMVLPIAKLIDHLRRTFPEGYDLAPLLAAYAHDDFEITTERASEFSICPLHPERGLAFGYEEEYGFNTALETKSGVSKKFEIYCDTPSSLALMHQGEPKALVSMLPIRKEAMMIFQLQGVRPTIKRDGVWKRPNGGGILGRIDWKRFLVSCVETVAEGLDYRVMAIQGAKNNKWRSEIDERFMQRLAKIYDATAERLGYSQREDGNWYKAIGCS